MKFASIALAAAFASIGSLSIAATPQQIASIAQAVAAGQCSVSGATTSCHVSSTVVSDVPAVYANGPTPSNGVAPHTGGKCGNGFWNPDQEALGICNIDISRDMNFGHVTQSVLVTAATLKASCKTDSQGLHYNGGNPFNANNYSYSSGSSTAAGAC